MKIAIVLPDLSKNGPVIYVKYLIEGLLSKADLIDVYYLGDRVELEIPSVSTFKITLFTKIDLGRYDIVHTHTAKADLYGLFNYKKIKHKWVSTIHNLYKHDLSLLYTPIKASVLGRIWKLALTRVRNVIVFSDSMEKYYQNEIGDKNYAVIRTGVPNVVTKEVLLEDRGNIQKLQKKFSIIGASGHLIKRKGFHQLVLFLKANREFALIITGDGPEKPYLEQLSKDLSVEDRVLFLGFKSNAVDYYAFYDIYALPSYAEGLPLSLLEALGQGLPIVCSRLDNYKDHFSDDDVVFFDLDNEASLEEAIHKAYGSSEYYSDISTKNYNEKFTIEIMANSYISYYKSIIK